MIKALALHLVVALALTASVVAAASPQLRSVRYEGIRPSDPGGRGGLPNPERGFRHEIYIGQPPGSSLWGVGAYLRDKAPKGFTDDWWLMNVRRYSSHGITLAQAYCYLDDFIDGPISEEKLAFLQRSLDRCRDTGIKVLLRFAYEKNMKKERGPTAERILAHLDQLAPLIQSNKDIIYVFQAGFVGAWGEWHSSTHRIEEDHAALAAILAKELEVVPEDRMIQLRILPRYKRWVLDAPILDALVELNEQNAFSGIPAARIALADDGFLANQSDGGTWTEPPFYANPGNPEFDAFTRGSS
ncbi:MAG: DUF4874 domain-containing protein, partial [Candidatus Hydrogenedentes bacterium]|nr:DUF4874 domain-containing protein [Candidatus Hydrogenedentota bacterium]